MNNWTVYLLLCADQSLYCGITNNLEKRIKEHNEGNRGAKYTRSRRPVVLFKSFSGFTKSEALKYEIKIKKLSRNQKLKL